MVLQKINSKVANNKFMWGSIRMFTELKVQTVGKSIG